MSQHLPIRCFQNIALPLVFSAIVVAATTHGLLAERPQDSDKGWISLFNGKDLVMDHSPVKDNEWFTQHVIVRGKRIVVKVNGEVTTDYLEPDDLKREESLQGRRLSSGTFAIQGHDPDSEILYRNTMVRPLDSETP